MRKVTYLGVFEHAEDGGYGVYFPDLPGCTSAGVTLEDVQLQAAYALGLHLYGMVDIRIGSSTTSLSADDYVLSVSEKSVYGFIAVQSFCRSGFLWHQVHDSGKI